MADAGSHERARRFGHRADAPVPLSTYRVQLTEDFTFADAAARLPYLKALGVSHVYLSPILPAAPGSRHFYDVVDHSTVSPVLGGTEGLRDLARQAHDIGMGLIADVVPNHMAVPTPVFHNRALWSVLAHGQESPFAHWFDVDWSSGAVLMPVLGERIGTVLSSEQLKVDTMVVPGDEQAGEVPVLRYYDHVFPVRPGTENLPLTDLVAEQNYRLAYWRVANEELNYRRFFDVGSLAAVRVEDPDVFEATHRVLVDLVLEGTLDGLRVDHPDGLADPEGYLAQLSEATEGAWIVVEKILENEERLPSTWKVAGTTGYDASWRIGALLRRPSGSSPLAGTMHRVTGDAMGTLPSMVLEAKREIVKESLSSEVHRLATIAHSICVGDVRLRDHTWRALYDCLRAMIVAFDRYRAYIHPDRAPHPTSLEAIDHAASRARTMLDKERHETLEVVVDLLKGLEVGSAGQRREANRTELVTRFQQACGAVMAKGVEDTAYYRWTHLLSLCEVGSPAAVFDQSAALIHAWAAEQQQASPHSMTCLTTHDIKRSEDVRARLNVLSEAAEEWDELVTELQELTAELRPSLLDGRMENLWWQTLVAASDDESAMAWERLEGYLTKAMREAKSFTTWTAVDDEYENAVLWFAQTTHADPAVRERVFAWHKAHAAGTRVGVLSQKALQLTLPGVPDTYQGTETLAPLLVDPDNRRDVDFDALAETLASLQDRKPRTLSEEKLLVTSRALAVRQRHPDAFIGTASGYTPVPSSSSHAMAFARTIDEEPMVVVVATRLGFELEGLGGWRAHTVSLPPGTWVDALTGHEYAEGAVELDELTASHPVAILERTR